MATSSVAIFRRLVGAVRRVVRHTLVAISTYPFIDCEDDPLSGRSRRKPGHGLTIKLVFGMQITLFPVAKRRIARVLLLLAVLYTCSIGMLIGTIVVSPIVLPVIFPGTTPDAVHRAIGAATWSCMGERTIIPLCLY
eukprot:88824-Prorocentrum_minimum.AAC.2